MPSHRISLHRQAANAIRARHSPLPTEAYSICPCSAACESAAALHHRTHRARAACRPRNHRRPAPSRYLLTTFTPHPATLNLSASRQSVFRMPAPQHAPQATTPRILPECLARCASGEEPRSSFACPRPAASPLRACPPPLACLPPVVSGRVARSARPPLAATAANAAPTARVACGCPSGQRALFVTRPATRVLRTVRFPARPSQASRSAPCRRGPPRFARPRRARLRLTPSPRSRRRPACPLHLPSLRAWRRSDSASIVRPRHHPTRATL